MTTVVQNSVELVQSLFAAFVRGDIQYIIDHVTSDVKWVAPGKGFVPIGGEYTGPVGVGRFFQVLRETEEINLFQPREYFVNGDDVVALGEEESRAVKTGKVVRGHWSMLFRIRDGKVYEWEQLFDSVLYAEAHREGGR